MIAGVIYNPANDELYTAERGKGAFLNDQRLRVAGRRQLGDCVIACGLPHIGRGDHNLSRLEMTEIQNKVAGLRRFGAASLDMAFVAAGRLDGYWERNLQPWDMAAGQIIIREAGGTVSGIEGDDDPLKTGNVICGNEYRACRAGEDSEAAGEVDGDDSQLVMRGLDPRIHQSSQNVFKGWIARVVGPAMRRVLRTACSGVAVPCGSAAGFRHRLRSRSPASTRCTTTKNTGTINSASTTTAIMPPITLVPSACWLAPPAPVAITIGSTPQTKARPVIRIGRKRSVQASTVASISGLPWARRSLANSMMRMASFAASPMMVIRPTVK